MCLRQEWFGQAVYSAQYKHRVDALPLTINGAVGIISTAVALLWDWYLQGF